MSAAYGLNEVTSPTSKYNAMRFAQEMSAQSRMVCTVVQVQQCTVNNAVGPIGRVQVLPLVQMVDGIQQTVNHITVYNLPYIRIQGGKYAFICDPQQNDLGIVISCDRDISGVKNSQAMAPPGSNRTFNISDGIYIGCCLTQGKPQSYVRFDSSGNIELSPDQGVTSIWVSPNRIDLGMKNAPHQVLTVDGPSQKVWAVINESGGGD